MAGSYLVVHLSIAMTLGSKAMGDSGHDRLQLTTSVTSSLLVVQGQYTSPIFRSVEKHYFRYVCA